MPDEKKPRIAQLSFVIKCHNEDYSISVTAEIFDDHIYCHCSFADKAPDANLFGVMNSNRYMWDMPDGKHPLCHKARQMGICILKHLAAARKAAT